MRDLAVLFLHLLATVARLAGPGGARAVVAESVLVKQQLLILNRSRKRSPNLSLAERLVAGVCTLLMRPSRLVRSAIVLKPSTLLRLRRALIRRKYRRAVCTDILHFSARVLVIQAARGSAGQRC
jgi:putative transposase